MRLFLNCQIMAFVRDHLGSAVSSALTLISLCATHTCQGKYQINVYRIDFLKRKRKSINE